MPHRWAAVFTVAFTTTAWLALAAQPQPTAAQEPARAPHTVTPSPPAREVPSLTLTVELSPSSATDSGSHTYTVSGVSVALPKEALPAVRRSWLSALRDAEIPKLWGPVLVGLVAIVATALFNRHQVRHFGALLDVERQKLDQLSAHHDATLSLERTKTTTLQANVELADIATKLNSFYGPFKQLRAQSVLLYRYFARHQKEEAEARGEEFRTLTHLAEANAVESLDPPDRQLLDAILGVGDSLLDLIEGHTGVVDKPALQDLLGKYAAHIRLLKLASQGKLTALGEKLREIVYPRAIDGAVESAVLRLQDRQRELALLPTFGPEHPHTPAVSPSVDYYNRNADEYTAATAFLDLRDLYKDFLSRLPVGTRILDAGCGPGRDTRAFIERGYRVVSFDASKKMVDKCRDYPHAYCLHVDLSEIGFKEEFDGVWACAVLLHLTEDEAKHAVKKLVSAMNPGGYLFISVKQGEGSSTAPDGRFFQYYDEKRLCALLATDARISEPEKLWFSKALKETAPDETWINAIFRRRRSLPAGKGPSSGNEAAQERSSSAR